MFEDYIKNRLHSERPDDGEKVWGHWISSKEEITQQVVKYISTVEPNLSDHGIDHIKNIINNIGTLLGFSNSNPCLEIDIPIEELMAMLMSALLHDIGNIEGRNNHHKAISKVLAACDITKNVWKHGDLATVEKICRAHTGYNSQGTRDTLADLDGSPVYFLGCPIRATQIAALLRYADELAEGTQRTSKYLIKAGKIDKGSQIFHQYASITDVIIDFGNRRVAVNFDIDGASEEFGNDVKSRVKNITALLDFSKLRISKMEMERRYCRYYAPEFIYMGQTCVSYKFRRNFVDCVPEMNGFVITDLDAVKLDLVEPLKCFTDDSVSASFGEAIKEMTA